MDGGTGPRRNSRKKDNVCQELRGTGMPMSQRKTALTE